VQKFSAKVLTVFQNVQNITVLTGSQIAASELFYAHSELAFDLSFIKQLKTEYELTEVYQELWNQELLWKWCNNRYLLASNLNPSSVHTVLAQFDNRIPNFSIITQNLDGLHRRAGSKNICELYGSFSTGYCKECKSELTDILHEINKIPSCLKCGSIVVPALVFPKDNPTQATYAKAIQACSLSEVFLMIGVTELIQIEEALLLIAKSKNALILEIATSPSDYSKMAYESYFGDINLILPELMLNIDPSFLH
jgi:NAD-dependent deacetylase